MESKEAVDSTKHRRRRILIGVVISLICSAFVLYFCFSRSLPEHIINYKDKLNALTSQMLTEETELAIGHNPAGAEAQYAAFLSICDTTERALVFCGKGSSFQAAVTAADDQVTRFLRSNDYEVKWLKADVVCDSEILTSEELGEELTQSREEFWRKGIALDSSFNTALLEAELNGAKIYDYENGVLDLAYMNTYLTKAGCQDITEVPDSVIAFECLGWFCDENNDVYELKTDELDYGRRSVSIDGDYANRLIMNASGFLEEQIQDDGSFIYGIYPRFDQEIDNYNIVRHASTLWSLLCRYRLAPDEQLAAKIEKTLDYMLNYVIYDPEGRAYLYEAKSDEIKLGGSGMAIVALTEYMDVFQNDKYKDVCIALGEGILSLLDQDTGVYYHVLNGDFTRKEEQRTVYYDGEATFALARLYGLTEDPRWLAAAEVAVQHFIDADYTQHKDHWVAYSMNEITKHIPDNREYYAFALANAQNNLEAIRERDTTYHTYLELLMATFETYQRMKENDIEVDDFDLQEFLDTVAVRADRQLNGYFYPEYAMYMKNPQRILDTFMVRHDGYRVRIDDIQHNIGGYYLYAKNYDALTASGMTPKG